MVRLDKVVRLFSSLLKSNLSVNFSIKMCVSDVLLFWVHIYGIKFYIWMQFYWMQFHCIVLIMLLYTFLLLSFNWYKE